MDRFVRPFVEPFRPISPIAWIPLAILWFGIGLSGKVFIIFIGSFFPALLNTIAGVKGVPPILITAAKTFGCSPVQLTTRASPGSTCGIILSFPCGSGDGRRSAAGSRSKSSWSWFTWGRGRARNRRSFPGG